MAIAKVKKIRENWKRKRKKSLPMKRRKWTAKQKAEIVRNILLGRKTIAEICNEYQIHHVQVHKWKNQAIENLDTVFVNPQEVNREKRILEKEIVSRNEFIGKMAMKIDNLKKSPLI